MTLRTTFKEDKREKLGELPKVFHLNLEEGTKFVETLNTKIASISSSVNTGADGLTTKITDLLIETCDNKTQKNKSQGKVNRIMV